MALRVILSTGGTGGHIFPALAVAEEIRQRQPDAHILFVGGAYGPEGKLAADAGLPFHALPVRGLFGRGAKALPAALAMAQGVAQAHKLLGTWKPDVCAGFGGYAGFATLFAASLRRLPTLIHEQNAFPGMANKVLAHFVRRICLSLPDTAHAFPPAKCVLTGNPIRADIAALGTKPRWTYLHKPPCLLVMGGSQGAKAINSILIQGLAQLRDAQIRIIHQCGPADFNRVCAAYASHGYSQEQIQAQVFPFIANMPAIYEQADLALCRAGATTVAELAAAGKPAIFIPFPHATHDHQTWNARTLEGVGAALLFAEADVLPTDSLTKPVDIPAFIINMLSSVDALTNMGKAAFTQAHPQAAAQVTDQIFALASSNPR